MIKPNDKIVIIGGGSAGWMTAAALIKTFPNKDITVIESPDVPIIGVGESTIGGIRDFTSWLEIDEKDFMAFTDASYKLSIKFTDFYEKDAGSFHYPFGRAQLDGTQLGIYDWFYKKHVHPETPVQDLVRSYFPSAALFESNKYSPNTNMEFDNFTPERDVAYHFDAVKFSTWLREEYCKPRGVKHIADTVTYVHARQWGIQSVQVASDPMNHINADLFIDCTGFKSMLLTALNEPFTSFSDMLPNNKAWATRVPYKNKEQELEPFTNCTAIENGWVWNIPLWSRLGTGYVYSDKFVSDEQALEEYKQYLMSNKMLYPRTREEVDALEYKNIEMRVGIHERTFVKNCVAIGLSAGFIEPLESNGLFSVHQFLFKLIKVLQRPAITQWDKDAYNAATYGLFRNFAEFVAQHYALSIRDDTEYWKANANRSYCPGIENLKPNTSQGFYPLADRKMHQAIIDPSQGITWISTGMNYLLLDSVDIKLDNDMPNVDAIVETFDIKQQRWQEAAASAPTLYQYLKDYLGHND
jgi:tryptophan halogenase